MAYGPGMVHGSDSERQLDSVREGVEYDDMT